MERTVCILLAFIVVANSLPLSQTINSDIDELLNNMSEEERVKFLNHNVRLGYYLTRNENDARVVIKEPEVPKEVSIYLYNYALKSFPITDEHVLKQLREVICFDDGTCVDIGDIGVHP